MKESHFFALLANIYMAGVFSEIPLMFLATVYFIIALILEYKNI